MNKQQTLQNAKRIVEERRFAANEKAAIARETLRANAEWAQLEKSLRALQVDLAMGKADDKNLQREIANLEKEQQKLLARLGFSQSDLLPHYHCSLCNDTGYVDGKQCVCLKKEIRKLIVADGNLVCEDFTFERSTETNERNRAVYKKVKELCQSGKGNVLLVGNVGAGKTYLLTACANLAADLGKSVLFVTSFNLNNQLFHAHVDGLETRESLFDALLDVDLLLIDDLGSEKVYKNITGEYLFALLNERILNRKQTFISTNLTLQDIREKYDERIFSRLVDQNVTLLLQLVGEDKRISKK